MNAKTITRIILLSVVGLAVGGWAMKEFGSNHKTTTDASPEKFIRPDGVTVINFHGEKRCRSCINIGTLAEKTLEKHFADEMETGGIHWEHVNYEAPGNTHYATDYELAFSTVVATHWKDGKEIAWARLDGVWDHLNDESAFEAYLVNGIRELNTEP